VSITFGGSEKLGNISENWLFDFVNDNSTHLYFALSDITSGGNFYHGVILNKSSISIRDSIDLASSTAKTGNISITIPDFQYQGSPISEELFGGSNHYINQAVSVHSIINTDSPVQIGSFRLINISSDGDKISLSMTAHRPWDFISIPNTSTKEGTFFPVAYGNYANETSTAASPQYCDSAHCFPTPTNEIRGDDIYCLLPYGSGFGAGDSDPSNEQIHYYDSNLDIFIPLDPVDNSSVNYQNGEAVTAPTTLKRGFKWNEATEGSGNEWSSFHNLTDASNYTHASVSSTYPTTEDTKSLFIDVKQPAGYFSALTVYVEWQVIVSSVSGGSPWLRLRMESPTGETLSTQYTGGTWTGNTTINIQADSNGEIPKIEFEAKTATGGSGEACAGSCWIRAFYVSGTAQLNTSEPDNLNKTLTDLKQLYSGCDSMPKSWTSGETTKIHEAHRDILIRYTGMTTSTPDGWSTVDTAKTRWGIRWWQLEPQDLEKTLNKLAYEGGFVFRYKSNGDPQYITVPGSPSASETLTKNDVSNIQIKHTPFSELLTKSEIEFNRHPVDNKYRDFYSWSNDTARTNWNIQSKENISNVQLDALTSGEVHTTHSSELDEELDSSETQITVDDGTNFSDDDIIRIDNEEMLITNIVSDYLTVTRGYRKTDAVTHEDGSDILVLNFTPISDFASYYDNIFGDIKTQVSGTIVNPKYYGIEAGDQIAFSDMYPEKIFNSSWSGKVYMVTSISRTPGTLKFEAREI